MATDKRVVRKNGIPVKKVWSEKVTQKRRDDSFTTTYPVYFTASHSSEHFDTVWSLTDEKAPRSLQEAIATAQTLIESEADPQTHATIYELRAVHRVGIEFDMALHTREQMDAHAAKQANPAQRFRLVSSTHAEG